MSSFQSVVREATKNDLFLGCLMPYMSKATFKKGATIFAKGDRADRMLYIHEGKIRVTDINGLIETRFLERGAVLGEIGIFAPDRKRTATAIAEADTEV